MRMNFNSKKYTKYYILALISIIGLALYSNTNTVIEGATSNDKKGKREDETEKNNKKFENALPYLKALYIIAYLVPIIVTKDGSKFALIMILSIINKDSEIKNLIGDPDAISKRTDKENLAILKKLKELILNRIGITDKNWN